MATIGVPFTEEQPKADSKPVKKINRKKWKADYKRLNAKYKRLQIVSWSLAAALIIVVMVLVVV